MELRKFPKLKYPNDPETDGVLGGQVVVTEKLDGANFRFGFKDNEAYIGTRNNQYHIDDDDIPVAFNHAVEWVRNLDSEVKNALHNAGTLFGEAMHLHSLEYQNVDYVNPSRGSPYFDDAPNVVLFDWWYDGGWADYNGFQHMCESLDLPTTRVIARGDGEELKDEGELSIPNESVFGGSPEGIVVRRVDGTVRAKKVSENFKETNAQAFDDPSKAQSNAAEFVAAFITKPRIEKTANKLVDKGEYDKLEMPMMEDLPREVVKDAFSEVGWSRLINGEFEAEWDDEFKDSVRSKASKKCSRNLRQLCQEF